MEYRRLGKAGLKVSALSLGAWVTYGGQVGEEVARTCMSAAYEAGVNFFDNAEAYAGGNAEIVMGNVIKKLGWRRESIVVSTKIFWGGSGPNDRGLSHKHIIDGVKQRKAFYCGTSEWGAAEIMRADGLARQYGLTPPSMEQPQYNMLKRERF